MNKKKLIAAIAVIGSTACVLGAACSHTHEYGEEWLKDEAYHWHECTSDDGATTDPVAHTYGSWTVTLTATEERAGEQKRECTVCGYEQTEVIGQLAHTHKYGEEWSNDEADHWKDCTADDDNKGYLAAHTYGEWEEVTEATEQAAGLKKQTCSVCGYVNEEVIPQLDHTHTYATAWTYDETNHWHKCNKTDCSTVSGTAKHTLEETVTKAATVDEAGVKKIECTVCDYEKTEPITMLASKQYKVTVLDASGEPVEGVTVKLGKYSAVTDEEGLATVKAELNTYTVELENTPTGATYDTLVSVTAVNSEATIYFATRVNGGRMEESPAEVADGVYALMLTATSDPDYPEYFDVYPRYFKVTATEKALKVRVEIVNDDTSVIPGVGDIIADKGAYFEQVIEIGESATFSVNTAELEIAEDYSFIAFFKVTTEEAPAAGVKERPAKAVEGENGKPAELEGDSVYLALDYATFGSHAKITYGAGVTVTALGLNKNAAGENLESGGIIKLAGSYDYYLIVTYTDAASKVTLEKYYLPGSAQNPLTAKADGTATAVEFDVEEGIYVQWYKATVEKAGDYVLKTDSFTSVLEVYGEIGGTRTARSGMGSALLLEGLTAGQTIYVRAADNDNANYGFTLSEFDPENDAGLAPQAPIALTSGEQKAYFGTDNEGLNTYYSYTATENCTITFTYAKSGRETFRLNVYSSADYDSANLVQISKNKYAVEYEWNRPLTLIATKGTTYYISTNGYDASGELDAKFTFTAAALETHSYVITVTDGEQTFDGVTVTLMNGEEEAASATTVEGKATMSAVPDNFTVKLTNLPSGYGYFADYAKIALNNDTLTSYSVKLYALKNYSVTVKLPNGEGAENVEVTFTNSVAGTFTETTGEDGIATVTGKLPPMAASNDGTLGTGDYTVTFTLPDSLKEDYKYTGTAAITLNANKLSDEITLTKMFAYSFTLVDGDGNPLGAGISVTLMNGSNPVNGGRATTDENGVATLSGKIVAGEYDIILNNGYATTTKTTSNDKNVTVVCTSSSTTGTLEGGTQDAPTLITNVGTYTVKTETGKIQFKFVGVGKFTFTISGTSFNFVRLNGTGSADKVIQSGKIILGTTDVAKNSDVVSNATDENEKITSFTLTIGEDGYIYFKFTDTGTFTFTITEVKTIEGGTQDAPTLITNVGTYTIKTETGKIQFKFVGVGKFTFTISGTSFNLVRLNGTGSADKVIQGGKKLLGTTDVAKNSDIVSNATDVNEKITSFTLTIGEDGYIYFKFTDTGTFTLTITEVTATSPEA